MAKYVRRNLDDFFDLPADILLKQIADFFHSLQLLINIYPITSNCCSVFHAHES
jgi:hypothetical protein